MKNEKKFGIVGLIHYLCAYENKPSARNTHQSNAVSLIELIVFKRYTYLHTIIIK